VIETPAAPVPVPAKVSETILPPHEAPEPPLELPSSTAEVSETPPEAASPSAPPWFRRTLPLALVLAAAIMLAGGSWLILRRPGPTAQEQKAWSIASREGVIPAYQGYLGTWPRGSYSEQATARIVALKNEAEDAYAKAKATNTAAAYQSFLATYARQGIEVRDARAAYDTLSVEEAKAKAAYDTATSSHTRDGYESFLSNFAKSTYAAEARQKLAACHSETRNLPIVKNTPLAESASGSGASSSESCAAARSRATGQAADSCQKSLGHLGAVRLLSETPKNDGLEGGRILGSIFGAISGQQRTSWKCTEEISVNCQTSTSAMQKVDICP